MATRKRNRAPADSPDMRFKDTLPLKKFRSKTIGIAGLGAVGRHVAILLGVMGHKKMYGADPDMVEKKNIGTQGWAPADVGSPKAQVLERTVNSSRSHMVGSPHKFEVCYFPPSMNIIFCCVDKMTARDTIWKLVKERKNLQGLWLDSRMASRVIRIIAVDLSSRPDRDHYESTLFNDTEAYEGRCTDRMTVYGAYIAAGWMVSQMANWLNGQLVRKDMLFETLGCSMTDMMKAGQ